MLVMYGMDLRKGLVGHAASLRGHEEAHSKVEVDGDGIRDSNRKQIDINRDVLERGSSWS